MTTDVPARFAVFSDVHANLPALEAFLDEADREGYKRLYCLGDLVGYGAEPNECCERVRERGIPVVLGNHDQAAVDLAHSECFNEMARKAILWTHDCLTPDNLDYLRGLPYVRALGEDFCFVHASPLDPEQWQYVLSHREAGLNFDAFAGWVCFIGHSHQPFVVELGGDAIECPGVADIALRRDRRYLINVGSIGQPRDKTTESCYVSVDLREDVLRFHRIAYPVKQAQESIEAAGLPPELAFRLGMGW